MAYAFFVQVANNLIGNILGLFEFFIQSRGQNLHAISDIHSLSFRQSKPVRLMQGLVACYAGKCSCILVPL